MPDALGIFVDNSGSLSFDDVNEGLFKFIDRVRATYPDVILPSDGLTIGDPVAIDQTTDPFGQGIQSGLVRVQSEQESSVVFPWQEPKIGLNKAKELYRH